ncbi:MAG: alcohol dehydrogenase [Phycisphaerales bacterium]|nr:MAG: alcohol dehydrogenase [Phycisphaerales bacterium]
MLAIHFDSQIQLRSDYPRPEPGPGECLIRVRCAGICSTDLHLFRGYMAFKGVPGHEMVGVVERGSPRWRGKRVVSEINCVCGGCDMCQSGLANHCRRRSVMGILGRDGCFAEYVVAPERNLHEMPASLSDEQAVFVEPVAAAYQVLQQCRIEPRTRVTVVGSGKLGLLVAQVLSNTGCTLDVVGRNPATLETADKLRIQSARPDELSTSHDRDVVVDCTGSPHGIELAMKLVRPRGTIVLKTTHAGAGTANLASIVIDELTVIGSRCGPFHEAIHALARGDVQIAPLLAGEYPLTRGLEAIAHADRPGTLKVLLRMA